MAGVLVTTGCRGSSGGQHSKVVDVFRFLHSRWLPAGNRSDCSFKNIRQYKINASFGNSKSWQETQSFSKQQVPKRKSRTERSQEWEETVQEINESYRKFQDEEMALLTDNPQSLPMLQAILGCPLKVQHWNSVTRKERDELQKLSVVFKTEKPPSVSKILRETGSPMSQIILNKWKKKKIEEMGEEGFKEYMHTLTSEGTEFHEAIEHFFGNNPVGISELGQWNSVLPTLEKISEVQFLETNVSHPFLSYQGRIDCVATFNGSLCVLDWKLSTSRKDTIKKCYDDPYQVAAYTGAHNMCNDVSNQISNAVIVKAYRDGTAADVHFLNDAVLEFYWEGWLRRLARHHIQIVNSRFKSRDV